MRLIDADALIEKLEAWKKEAERRDASINYTFASAIIAQVNAEPTVEERKRGEWIPGFDGKFTGGAYWFSCSNCKRIVPEVRNGGWNFCPNCGADMRGGQDG